MLAAQHREGNLSTMTRREGISKPWPLALELACSAVTGMLPSKLVPGALATEPLPESYAPFGSPCVLVIVETFLGCKVMAEQALLQRLQPFLETEPVDGAVLSTANSKRLLRIAEKAVPIADVWRDDLYYTDRVHFAGKKRHPAVRLTKDHLPDTGPERAHAGRGAFEGASGIIVQGKAVSYADYVARNLLVSSIGVFTDPEYRGQGLGASVVSAATEAILNMGKVPIYCTDLDNAESRALCQSLGYLRFGSDLYAFM